MGQDDLTRFDSKIKSGKRKRAGQGRSGGKPKGEQARPRRPPTGRSPSAARAGARAAARVGPEGGDKPKEG